MMRFALHLEVWVLLFQVESLGKRLRWPACRGNAKGSLLGQSNGEAVSMDCMSEQKDMVVGTVLMHMENAQDGCKVRC